MLNSKDERGNTNILYSKTTKNNDEVLLSEDIIDYSTQKFLIIFQKGKQHNVCTECECLDGDGDRDGG